MDNCLFCKIARGEIPAEKVYDKNDVVVFKDIHPQAPIHLLAIPREHFAGIHEIPESEMGIMARVNQAIAETVKAMNLADKGYRLVVNYGPHSGQEVPHIHVHILSGRQMKWPPG